MNCLLLAHPLVLAVIIRMTSRAVAKSYKFPLWPVWYPQGCFLFFFFKIFFLFFHLPTAPICNIKPFNYFYFSLTVSGLPLHFCLIYIKVFESFINLFWRLTCSFCGFSLNQLLSCYCHVNIVVVSIIFFPMKTLDIHLFNAYRHLSENNNL